MGFAAQLVSELADFPPQIGTGNPDTWITYLDGYHGWRIERREAAQVS